MSRGAATLLVLVAIVFEGSEMQRTQNVPEVEDKWDRITRYMSPLLILKRDFANDKSPKYTVAHVSKIEELEMVKNPNVKFSTHDSALTISISRRSCKQIHLCFGDKTNLGAHRDIAASSAMKSTKKIWNEIWKNVELNRYEIEACKNMRTITFDFPDNWYWASKNALNDLGSITYNADPHSTTDVNRRTRMTLLSNHMHISLPNTGNGIKIYQAFNVSYNQDQAKCAARMLARETSNSHYVAKSALTFVPATVHRDRAGNNIWAVPLGFLTGMFIGTISASIVLCCKTKTFYKKWNDRMKKTFGKFASTDGVSMMGGVSTMGGGGLSAMGGLSTIGGGLSTIGGGTTMGGDGASTISKV